MRLLLVIDSLGSGGAQRQLVSLGIGLAKRGHEVEFFAYYPRYQHFGPFLSELGIAVRYVEKGSRWSLVPLRALRPIVRGGGWDGVLAFLPTPSLYAEVARLGLKKPPLVVSQRFSFTAGSLGAGGWLLQQAHRLADHITVNTHSQRELMEHKFPWMRNKISTIYNGVDLRLFRPPDQARQRREDIALLAVGSVLPSKNVLRFIKALGICRDQYGVLCKVRWAGKVDAGAGGQEELLAAQRLLKDLRLDKSWEWLGECTDIPELLRKHDALIHPSLSEGLPNAICEALASGLPVLAGSISDNARLVQNGVTGSVFDPGDPSDIARSIHEFASLSASECMLLGRQARRLAEKELGLDVYVAKYEELFSQLGA